MNIVERTNLILNLLEKHEYLMVNELSEKTGMSKATIRRDLQTLEEQNLIRRFHGGACLKDSVIVEDKIYFHERMATDIEEKRKIAKKAAALIENGDVLFLDAGSTAFSMIEYIEAKEIHVITNSIQNAMALITKGIPTYILGGEISLTAMNILDEDTIDKMKELHFDKAFLGAGGVDDQAGYTTTDKRDCKIKRMAVSQAADSYVLADSRKMGKRKFFTFAGIEQASCVTSGNVGDIPPLPKIILA